MSGIFRAARYAIRCAWLAARAGWRDEREHGELRRRMFAAGRNAKYPPPMREWKKGER